MNLPHTMIEFYDVFGETLLNMGMNEEIKKMNDHIDQKRKPVEYLKKLILEAGFDIKTINVDGFRMKYNDGTAFLNHHIIRHSFMESWKSILPDNIVTTVFNTIEQKLNQVAKEKGELIISVPFVCFDCYKLKIPKT
jgi:hypothetical protein